MTRTTYKRVPFSLELAKKITNKEAKGRIVTRDGRQVRIICFDKIGVHGACQIVALLRVHPDEETVFAFSNEGVYRFGHKTCFDLFLEVPTYYRDYTNFVPQKYQPCLVRDGENLIWFPLIYAYTDCQGKMMFYDGSYIRPFSNVLPLSKVTERLIGTTKNYEQLIEDSDGNGQD